MWKDVDIEASYLLSISVEIYCKGLELEEP